MATLFMLLRAMMKLELHKRDLETWGFTKLNGFLCPDQVAHARELIQKTASNQGVYSSQGWQRSQNRFTDAKALRRAINALAHSDTFPNLISEPVVQLTEALLGEAVQPMSPGQQILFTLPGAQTWFVPKDAWHVDAPRLGNLGPPGLQFFTFLDDVDPKGGGTLVVAGSHRLLNTSRQLRSKELKRRLGAKPYFRSLFDKKNAPITHLDDTIGMVGDVDLKVVEFTGRAGDVYIMDLRMLHTPAPNASDRARLMLTCRFPRAAIVSQLMSTMLNA